MSAVPPWALRLAVVVAVAVSLAVVRRLDGRPDPGRHLRTRLLLGIPWGTAVSLLGVLFVYLFVQGGIDDPSHPVTVAFRAWSYLYPLGMLTAPFAHQGPGHLVGNLVTAAVFGSIAEFAWGHFPRERGRAAFSSARWNPYVRAFVLFPAGVAGVGLLTSLFSWGPVIGFSGVAFAMIGFALVRYPLGSVIALSADGVIRLAYRALSEPVLVREAEPQFVKPWWAGVAIQGHLLGLFLGVALGAALLRRERPSPPRLWAGTVIVATSFSLWAIWWFRGGEEFVLYRGVGVVLVAALALLVVLGRHAAASDYRLGDVPLRTAGLLALLFPVLVVGFAAVPLNLATVADTTPPGDTTVDVRDYRITYAEDVPNRQVSVVNLSAFGETTQVNASGVIVVSERRHVWTEAVPKSRLAFTGTVGVRVGGLGWDRAVLVRRRGWGTQNGPRAYRIAYRVRGGEWHPMYRSDPAIAGPVLAGRNVSIAPADTGFVVRVTRDNHTLGRSRLPTENRSVRAGGVRFVRDGRTVFAEINRTRVQVATREKYE